MFYILYIYADLTIHDKSIDFNTLLSLTFEDIDDTLGLDETFSKTFSSTLSKSLDSDNIDTDFSLSISIASLIFLPISNG